MPVNPLRMKINLKLHWKIQFMQYRNVIAAFSNNHALLPVDEPSGPLSPKKEGEKGIEMETKGGTEGFHQNLLSGWVPEISGACGSN